MDPNQAFILELYYQYLKDPNSVSPQWRQYFLEYKPEDVSSSPTIEQKKTITEEKQITQQTTKTDKEKEIKLSEGEVLEQLSTISSKIALNMEISLSVPTATSTRTIPIKPLEENRRIINKYLEKIKRQKISFTHILAWAIIRALKKYPHLNDTIIQAEDKYFRVRRKHINLGIATDIQKQDGTRLLLVPNIKKAEELNFIEFIDYFDNIISKARNNKLELDDLQNTTISITNPGMIGTTFSNPRLMQNQSMIIATGSIDYPSEFQAVSKEILSEIAISKVITISNTYDHRIIQGAESAEFLAYISRLLLGEELFYDQIFATLKIPFEPIRWQVETHKLTTEKYIEKSAHVVQMINAYRVRGHLLAAINPLGFASYYYPELDPNYYGFTIWDLDRIFHADDNWKNNNLPLREIIEILRDTYCGEIGFEFMHIQDSNKKDWIKNKLENIRGNFNFSTTEKINILKKIIEAEEFENFLHTKFIGHKRFSLEGGEVTVALMDKLLELSADNDLQSVVIGMAHRGRLNILANNLGKSLEQIFSEFEGDIEFRDVFGSGDVKYHLGYSGKVQSRNGNEIEVIMAPNPSHLELINPVIEGIARAINFNIKDNNYTKALPILIHGDSAFAGQGIVAETLNLANLEGYKTGGTIHIIINNQIGFTTSFHEARSSVYATDIAKMIQVPIIHVNGNNPEAVIFSALFAFEYRQTFHNDIVIDILCYRKYGHNEGDEPSYSQPLLYKKIKNMQPLSKIYGEKLIKEKIINEEQITDYLRQIQQHFYNIYNNKENYPPYTLPRPTIKGTFLEEYTTKIDFNELEKIAKALFYYPEEKGFTIHPKIKSFIKKREESFYSKKPAIDWAFAESLSFGSLLLEGFNIRLSGEDSRRGTFSQRHSVLIDYNTEEEYIPLNNIAPNQGIFKAYDSPLSELAVLGFEFGFSIKAEKTLTLWEAQFGDFANMAQPIIDQFISCSEVKWNINSGLVLLLPHGYEGQGPEHSSARLERYLQLASEENIVIANLTYPSQYFHILRRQALAPIKKPLIIMTPKSTLRHPLSVSSVDDLTNGKFEYFWEHPFNSDVNAINKLLFCSGKIYFELLEAILKQNIQNLAIITIEQLYPFNEKKFKEIVSKYHNIEKAIWVQEEPQNMGAYPYIAEIIQKNLPKETTLGYIGRKESSATATGYYKIHLSEQQNIIENAINY